MLILLRYLRHLAIGQQEIVHFLEPLIERFENPLAFALPRAVAQWRATIYTGLSRLTDMGGMLTRAVAALVFTLNERIPRINAFMEDLYSIPATLYRNGTINQVDYELSEAHMHQLKIRLMRGIPDLSNLDRLSHEIATAFLFTPYELAHLRQSRNTHHFTYPPNTKKTYTLLKYHCKKIIDGLSSCRIFINFSTQLGSDN